MSFGCSNYFWETTNFPTLIFNKGIGVGIQIVFKCSSKCTPCKWSIKNWFIKKEWIKGVMRRVWFYELFSAVLFLRLMSVGEIATWVFLDWKGRALSKRGVVYGTLVFRTESVDGKQRKGFYVVSYSDEPCLEMVIFLYIPSVLVWNFFVMDRGGGRDQNMYLVLFTRH